MSINSLLFSRISTRKEAMENLRGQVALTRDMIEAQRQLIKVQDAQIAEYNALIEDLKKQLSTYKDKVSQL